MAASDTLCVYCSVINFFLAKDFKFQTFNRETNIH